jgi:hypothetical protein
MTRRDLAIRALDRYRAAAAARGEAAACLLARAREVAALAGHERRRAELVDRAMADSGIAWDEAERVYDLAREEGLDPALAFELLHCGVLVREPAAPPRQPEGDTLLEASPPEWIDPASTVPPPDAGRERRLRASFRRLRRLLEERGAPEEALVAYAEEPDVVRLDG